MRFSKKYSSLPYNQNLHNRAATLRKAGNLAEALFWNEVKNDNKYEYDCRRDEYMNKLGLHVIRISDEGVRHHMEMELEYISNVVKELKKTTPSIAAGD
ncbi:MAG: endonuclease domain-containing protein [Proteobacteria bacterium]|nr:endonuclease domain-containing protein [Pseudomonadota bacterium]